MSKKRTNGEGSIFFDEKKKLYRGQVKIGYDDDSGRMKRKSVSGKTKTEVLQKMKQIELQIFSGDYVDENSITIRILAEQIEQDKLSYNEITEATYFRNTETIKRLKEIYNCPIQQASETQIKAFFQKRLDYSQSTLNKDYRMLNAVFKEAVKRKIINENPMENIKRPKSRKQTEKVRALTVDEQAKLINILLTEDIKYSQQMLIQLYTGMRMGEINALTKKDINLNFNSININKTITRNQKGNAILNSTTKTETGRRTIRINEEIRPLLVELVEYAENDFLFLTENGDFVHTNQVNMELKRLFKKYGLIDEGVFGKVSCHSLRHTYATRCIESGMPAKILQKQLGHKDIATTMNIYCDAFESYEDKYAEIVNEYIKQQGLSLNAV